MYLIDAKALEIFDIFQRLEDVALQMRSQVN